MDTGAYTYAVKDLFASCPALQPSRATAHHISAKPHNIIKIINAGLLDFLLNHCSSQDS